MSLGLFWGGVNAATLAMPTRVGTACFFLGFAAGWASYRTLLEIWGAPMFVRPGAGYQARRRTGDAAVISILRPTFVKLVLEATGWPPVLVGGLLAALLASAPVARLILVSVTTSR
ncbi:MAG: hypothetical protein ACT4OS_11705 [Acidimicrobiales bacterium]